MKARPIHAVLTRRERQLMDVLFRLGRGTATEIQRALPERLSNSTVRTQLRVLEGKGYVKHQEEGLRYAYMPAVSRHSARRSALKHLIDTFFGGSSANLVAALLGGEARVTDDELERIADLVKGARKEPR